MTDSVKKATDGMKDDLRMMVVETVYGLVDETVQNSPKVTGRHVNNINTSVGKPDNEERNQPNTNATQSKAQVKRKLKFWKAGQDIFITCAAPYAYWIEYGNTRGAPPQAFMRRAMASLTKIMKKAADKIK